MAGTSVGSSLQGWLTLLPGKIDLDSTLLGSDCSDLTGSFRIYKKPVIEKIMT